MHKKQLILNSHLPRVVLFGDSSANEVGVRCVTYSGGFDAFKSNNEQLVSFRLTVPTVIAQYSGLSFTRAPWIQGPLAVNAGQSSNNF